MSKDWTLHAPDGRGADTFPKPHNGAFLRDFGRNTIAIVLNAYTEDQQKKMTSKISYK